ncbi:MAG: hypothetical protein HY863_06200 [Chloroflexi bacterium]|nr:hypothetical protein [Chloroflexota bacterium]
MKKTLVFTLILFTVLTLAACGASNTQQTNSSANGGNNIDEAPLPLATELMIGTFKLEGTDNAVTAEEASQLLPLWQVYKDLTSSSSAAQEEVDALADQIKTTMTPKQVQAITDMKLTRADMFQIMTDLGIASAGRPNASGTPQPGGGPDSNLPPGGGPGGNFPPGGPGFNGGNGAPGGGGQDFTPAQIATAQASRAQGGGGGFANRIPPALYDALIKLLQEKK